MEISSWLEMINKAKEAGCNAIKFQAYLEGMVKDHPERSRLMDSTITKANVETINELSNSVGIDGSVLPCTQKQWTCWNPL